MKKVAPPVCTLASVMVSVWPGELSGTDSTVGVPGMSTLQRPPSGLTAVQPWALAVPANSSSRPIHCTTRIPISLKGLGEAHENAGRAVAGVGAALRVDASVGIGHHDVETIGRRDQRDLPIPIVAAREAVGREGRDREVADWCTGLGREC